MILMGMRYELPPDWYFRQLPGNDHRNYSVFMNTTEGFEIVKAGGKDIVSDNGNFSLASHDQGKYLLLHMNRSIYPLSIQFPLEDAASLVLQNSGNVLINFYNGSVRQSFDFPSEFFLPTQILKTGMRIMSNNYETLVIVQDEGLFWISPSEFYEGQFQHHQPYQAWRFNSTCEGSTSTFLQYTGSNLTLSNDCEQLSLTTSTESSTPLLPFLHFDSDGSITSYKYEGNQWIKDIQLTESSNQIKSWPGNPACKACSQYEICNADNGSCSCLKPDEHQRCELYTSNFDVSSCSKFDFLRQQYRNYIVMKHKFSGIGYYRTEFMQPNRRNSSLDECTNACFAMNCSSCMSLIFNGNTKDCFFISYDIYGSFYKDDTTKNITLIIKTLKAHHQPKLYIITLTMTSTVIFLCFLAVCALAFNERKLKFNPAKEIEALLASLQGRLPQRFSYTALDTATKGYSTKLGAGGYGSVYKGVLSDGRVVAVKKLDYSGTQGAKQFVTEIVGIGGISHVNIVKLCGFCIEGATQWLLVYEFMPNGSLDKWLFEQTSENLWLSWQQRIDIALGTAQGLAYLHEECREPILHLDIKPQNILLDTEFVAKVADFGMAKLLENRNETQVMTTMRGTPGYMAPEWLTHFMSTKRCDVYSYGKVLLELIGGRRNIDLSKAVNSGDNTQPDESWYFPTWVVNQVEKGNFLDVIDERVRASASENYQQAKKMVHLALWCIQDNADARPSMRTVVEVLQGHLDLGSAPLVAKVAFR
ncbi:G-type lectin S-receptor-like serine/threonine-protein kinase SD2-5 isoform X1 [Selaginella moellendorffii]|uniref:G-type lectin S-receptor-like serine/threonine-protein kinase SD2-5 isoform X1 n=2 Tax=Selaginella moellendorffii TaxID=88036 RepID=UPI000D1CBF87|nr:G-type lectin S-receptor-like serine/threonine-protein kinase SD2-5 isoform X1 [Selaginella moellendorffii]|eukprot:XP_024522049.1 G-type lectin S-receptor-like serine/threonine-protein kinase SD2-5 isoform X1 [Selaginella moellendorffii]